MTFTTLNTIITISVFDKTTLKIAYVVSPEKVNISEGILNFFTNNYQFDY